MVDENAFVRNMLSNLNSNVPIKRRTILDYYENNNLQYETKSGSVCEIVKEQFDEIFNICDDLERTYVRLPIFITTDTSGEISAWKVEGKYESSLVKKILDKKIETRDTIRLYFSDYKKLTSRFTSCFFVVFSP